MPLTLRRPAAPLRPTVPPPPAVMLFLDDFCGGLCHCLVSQGQTVRLGEPVGSSSCGAAVHAPISGVVRAVGSGALVIENDFQNTPDWRIEPLACLEDAEASHLLARLARSGLLTADFTPLPQRLEPCHALALAVLTQEDYLLFSALTQSIFGGLRALARLVRPRRLLLFHDPRCAPVSRAARALCFPGELIEVDGTAPQLNRQLTGRSLERGVTLGDLGCLVFSPQGAAALFDAIYLGQPHLKTTVVLLGPGGGPPAVCTVPLGTSLAHLLTQTRRSAPTVLQGVEKRGRILRSHNAPLTKTDMVFTCLSGPALTPTGRG